MRASMVAAPAVGLACALAWAAPAQAQITNGQQLLGSCAPAQADPQAGTKKLACVAYVMGATDAVLTLQDVQPKGTRKTVCLTGEMTPGTVIGGVLDFVRARPDNSATPSGMLILLALAEKFPCPK